MTSGEFSEEASFKVKDRNGAVLLDASEFDWSCIFEDSWLQEGPGDSMVESFDPRVLVQLKDIEDELGEPLTTDHIFFVRDTDYPISDVKPDGHGMAYVALRRALP